MDQIDIPKFVANSYSLKPEKLVMSELKWKYLTRSGLRGKNVVILGPSGQGKTLAVQCLVDALDRRDRYFYFNLGATQDPRATLIGSTHFSKETGTLFDESRFVKAIRTPNAIVHLDELSRAHPDASNILLTPLDYLQRYLSLDEKVGGEIVKVANGVCFVATANIGNEYTNTRVMDKALMDRFTVKIEVDFLTAEEELNLVSIIHPNADMDIMRTMVDIAATTREYYKSGKVNNCLSTRTVVEMAELTMDGFTLEELVEMILYPDYSAEGGVDSERTLITQLVQMYNVPTVKVNKDDEGSGNGDDNDIPF